MNRKFSIKSVFILILSIGILSTVTIRSIAIISDFDFTTSYFRSDTLITIASYLTVGFCVLLFSAMFSIAKGKRLLASFSSPATYVPAGAVCAALAFLSVNTLTDSLLFKAAELSSSITLPSNPNERMMLISEPVLFILGVLAIIHLALTAGIDTKSSYPRAYLGLCMSLFLGFYAAYLYFTVELPINSPNKIVDQMAYLFAALFFLYETRLSMGRERWGAYTAFGLIASLLTAYSSIPSLICYLATKNLISHSIYETVFTLSLFIFITSRLLVALFAEEDKESDFTRRLKAMQTERPAIVTEITGEDTIIYNQLQDESSEDAFSQDAGAYTPNEIFREAKDLPEDAENTEQTPDGDAKL